MSNQPFRYTYSAKEQAEIQAIRRKYTAPPQDEDAVTRLRRLDAAVTKKATVPSLVIGILGTLLLGGGMSLAISELGAMLGLSATVSMLIGIPVGGVGIVLTALAYPVYNRILKRERERIAPEILRLTDELIS